MSVSLSPSADDLTASAPVCEVPPQSLFNTFWKVKAQS